MSFSVLTHFFINTSTLRPVVRSGNPLLLTIRNYGQRLESRQWKQKPNRKPKMTLILTQSVVNLGNRGDVVRVKGGYGRNYLVPKGKAVYAHHESCKEFGITDLKAAIKKSETKEKVGGLDLIKRQFLNKTLIIKQDPAAGNWSVREQHIANDIAKQFKVHVPLDYIYLKEPLRQFGPADVDVKLAEGEELINVPIDIIHKVKKEKKKDDDIIL